MLHEPRGSNIKIPPLLPFGCWLARPNKTTIESMIMTPACRVLILHLFLTVLWLSAARGQLPTISAQPSGGVLNFRETLVLSVQVQGGLPVSYQWRLNGTDIPGAARSTHFAVHPGIYTVSVANAEGKVESAGANIVAASRLVNVSSKLRLTRSGQTLILGFAISGPEGARKTILVRAVGPSLSRFGITSPLSDTMVTVYQGSVSLGTNTGWISSSASGRIPEIASKVGAFPFGSSSLDSAIILDLSPGLYTVHVRSPSNSLGECLAELYETDHDSCVFTNVSTLAQVDPGVGITLGMVMAGEQRGNFLIRGSGPALGRFVGGGLLMPLLTLRNAEGAIVGQNAGWYTSQDAVRIQSASGAVSAFGYAPNSGDAALVSPLSRGTYTTDVTGQGGSGFALAEVYLLP